MCVRITPMVSKEATGAKILDGRPIAEQIKQEVAESKAAVEVVTTSR